VTRLLPHLERLIDLGLIFLLAFTPLAFGSVDDWAQALAQFVVVVVFAAWVLKITWGPAPLIMHLDDAGVHASARVSTHRRRPAGLFGGRVRLSGLEAPALLFAVLAGLQLVSLPSEWLDWISPNTANITRDALPPATGGSLTVAEFESWLLQPPDPPDGPAGRLPTPVPGEWRGSLMRDAELPVPERGNADPVSLAPEATKRQLAIYLAYFAVFVMGINQWRDRRHADRILATLAVMAGAISLFGIVQKLTWSGRLYWLRQPSQGDSPFGPFVNSNHFAGYLEMILPLIIGLAVATAGQMRQERDPRARLLERGEKLLPRLVLLWAAAIFGSVALVASGSRGGLLSVLSAGALFLVLSPLRRPGGWKVVPVGLLLVALAVGVAGRVGGDELWTRHSSLADPVGDPSFAVRLDAARRAIRMTTDFPVVGVGLGAFDVAYPMYVSGGWVNRTGAAHNNYAQLAAETGIVGAGLASIGLAILLAVYLVPALVRSGSPRRHVVHGLAVGILAMLVHSAFDFNLQVYSNGLVFVVLVALLAADRLSRLPQPGPSAAGVAPTRS
jgi:O-antigen ligase